MSYAIDNMDLSVRKTQKKTLAFAQSTISSRRKALQEYTVECLFIFLQRSISDLSLNRTLSRVRFNRNIVSGYELIIKC